MKLCDACTRRRIGIFNITTPLIVPSFSSCFCKEIGEIHHLLRPYITEASLVSAFDIHSGHLSLNEIYASDLLIVDSGCYESKQYSEGKSDWTEADQMDVLNRLMPMSQIVVVNYDALRFETIDQENDAAGRFFRQHREYASDFLIKPLKGNTYIDAPTIVDNIDSLSDSSILGFTEEELGSSLVQRCSSIYAIRKALLENGNNTPIHIFGCIDPISVLVYFFCGADIFDGLAWLRYAFLEDLAVYAGSYPVVTNKWEYEDEELRILRFINNLQVLSELQQEMQSFCQDYSLKNSLINERYLMDIMALVKNVGIKE
jgi:hypothetical protein